MRAPTPANSEDKWEHRFSAHAHSNGEQQLVSYRMPAAGRECWCIVREVEACNGRVQLTAGGHCINIYKQPAQRLGTLPPACHQFYYGNSILYDLLCISHPCRLQTLSRSLLSAVASQAWPQPSLCEDQIGKSLFSSNLSYALKLERPYRCSRMQRGYCNKHGA